MTEKSKNLESKDEKYSSIKKNILELYFSYYNQNHEKKRKRKWKSEPCLKYNKKNLKKKISDQKNSIPIITNISKKEEENNANELNIKNEKQNNLNDLFQEKNGELKNKEINNQYKTNNINIISNNNIFQPRLSKDSKDLIEKIINNSGGLLNINEKASNNDILNLNNKYSSKEFSSPNSNRNLNFLNYCSNSNTNKSNYAFNFFGINNNQEDNSSLNSSKNELSSKNVKKNSNTNLNNINNLSSSSLGKNFVLKSEICKSTFHNENKYYKNNNSEDNPIMTYFSKDIKDKNFGNFYLFTDRKSEENIDQNKYLNVSPFYEKSSKKKEKNIISCNYIDNNNEIPEKINTDIINENDEHSIKYNFILNEFHVGENKEDKLNLQTLIQNFGDNNTNNNSAINKNNKTKTDTIFENDNIDKNIDNLIKEEKEKENQIDNKSNDKNIINNQKENNNQNKNDNNSINLINTNQNNNLNCEQHSFPLDNKNIYSNIYNNNYKPYQINPLMNPGINNYFSNQNMNINPITNYFSQNFQQFNYYQQFFNGSSINSQNNYFNPINNHIDNNNPIKKDINDNNIIEINNNLKNNKIHNINKNIHNNIYNQNEDIQNKNFYDYSDEEILNLSIKLINDQFGCRFMQEKIKADPNFANEFLFPKIKYNLKELCCDCFGNYFMQLLVDILSFDNINKFFDMTQNVFTEICISPHGTRVIQKIIDKISATPILMNRFIYNLNSKDLGIIFKSPYGNHMIQKILTTIHSSEYSNFIFNYIYNNFLDIANSKHGVCVIQKCVNEGDEKQRNKIYGFILNNFNILINDQFGNYLIQYILINTKTEEKFKEIFPIIFKIEENFLYFCKSKYPANVIEKCFENCENMIREHILDYFLKNYSEYIMDLLLDQYGLYVIQKALKMNNPVYKYQLTEIINSKQKELREINFSDYKYKNIVKIINSSKELGEVLGKIIKFNNNAKINIENNNDNNNFYKKNYYKGEEKGNDYFSYNNNRGNNKRGRKYYRVYNNNY